MAAYSAPGRLLDAIRLVAARRAGYHESGSGRYRTVGEHLAALGMTDL